MCKESRRRGKKTKNFLFISFALARFCSITSHWEWADIRPMSNLYLSAWCQSYHWRQTEDRNMSGWYQADFRLIWGGFQADFTLILGWCQTHVLTKSVDRWLKGRPTDQTFQLLQTFSLSVSKPSSWPDSEREETSCRNSKVLQVPGMFLPQELSRAISTESLYSI